MISKSSLVFTDAQHTEIHAHLFPGDDLEAAAILLCHDIGIGALKLAVSDFILVPHGECQRARDHLVWPGQTISDAIDRAESNNFSIVLIHSHPGGYREFSELDDESDALSIRSIFGAWSGTHVHAGHGSAIMLPDGEVICRLYDAQHACMPVSLVVVPGDTIKLWWHSSNQSDAPMAFGSGMTDTFGRLHACIIGVSGTGSVVAEQAARMGFGKITLIDFDRVEAKNLNRILNSTVADVSSNAEKVAMFAKAISTYRPDASIVAVAQSIATREAVLSAACADIIFSCVDSSEGRHIADRVGQAFLIPLIDMGVTIPTRRLANGSPVIAEVSGRIDYVKPGGATLGDRLVYTGATLRAEYLARVAPDIYAAERAEGYIKGAAEEAPSVIALNMKAASSAMLEFIARVFPFRHAQNQARARTIFALADGDEDFFSESDFDRATALPVGIGAQEPLLGLPELGA